MPKEICRSESVSRLRRNEISDLARDFDEMAGKIEDLVGAQKRLLRDISHELRSPLTRLGLALELARHPGRPESQDNAFARIELESERMNIMIGQLLELTRLENGSGRSEFKTVDMGGLLLQELVRDAGFEAAAKGGEKLSLTRVMSLRFYGGGGKSCCGRLLKTLFVMR